VPHLGLTRQRTHRRPATFAALATAVVLAAAACSPATKSSASAAQPGPTLNDIQHLVAVYMENWSFDSLYASFPGVDGLAGASRTTQVDNNGVPYPRLPQPLDSTKAAKPTAAVPAPAAPGDPRFPADLANAPFNLETYVPPTQNIGDLTGRFYQEQAQIDGGKMDEYVAHGGAGALPLGYYDASPLPLGLLAKQYTLADQYFHAAFGGSMLNHFWLISGATPQWTNAPDSLKAVVGPGGQLIKDGAVTPDGYLVNTAYPAAGPHPASTPASQLVPPLQTATIGDRLSAKGISWAWYSGGWANALAGRPDPLFQFNHQPFAYFANYANGTPGQAAHLKDETDLVAAIRNNTLPAVSFYKPIGADNEHPGYANLLDGERHAADLIQSILASPAAAHTAIIVTYDENGGFWDHVPPPLRDRWGPGTRVPAIVISPYAKKGFVDHTDYDTTSVLALIEHRYGLTPLGSADAMAADLQNAFMFKH
jgi:phospholipase C